MAVRGRTDRGLTWALSIRVSCTLAPKSCGRKGRWSASVRSAAPVAAAALRVQSQGATAAPDASARAAWLREGASLACVSGRPEIAADRPLTPGMLKMAGGLCGGESG
jgi:hypothetical protein